MPGKLSNTDPRLEAINHVRRQLCEALRAHGIRCMNLIFALKPQGFQDAFHEIFARGQRTLVFGQQHLDDGEWAIKITLGQTNPTDLSHPTHTFEIMYCPGPFESFRRFGESVARDARWTCTVDDTEEAHALMACIDPRLLRCPFEPTTPRVVRRRLDTTSLDHKDRRHHTSPFFLALLEKMVAQLAATNEYP